MDLTIGNKFHLFFSSIEETGFRHRGIATLVKAVPNEPGFPSCTFELPDGELVEGRTCNWIPVEDEKTYNYYKDYGACVSSCHRTFKLFKQEGEVTLDCRDINHVCSTSDWEEGYEPYYEVILNNGEQYDVEDDHLLWAWAFDNKAEEKENSNGRRN